MDNKIINNNVRILCMTLFLILIRSCKNSDGKNNNWSFQGKEIVKPHKIDVILTIGNEL